MLPACMLRSLSEEGDHPVENGDSAVASPAAPGVNFSLDAQQAMPETAVESEPIGRVFESWEDAA